MVLICGVVRVGILLKGEIEAWSEVQPRAKIILGEEGKQHRLIFASQSINASTYDAVSNCTDPSRAKLWKSHRKEYYCAKDLGSGSKARRGTSDGEKAGQRTSWCVHVKLRYYLRLIEK
jgi:hypothetical protein